MITPELNLIIYTTNSSLHHGAVEFFFDIMFRVSTQSQLQNVFDGAKLFSVFCFAGFMLSFCFFYFLNFFFVCF